jgi:hypothetical protein
MNEREKLIKEIEQAPEFLVEEVLDFLLFTKNRKKNIDRISNCDMEMQLRAMAEDLEIQKVSSRLLFTHSIALPLN